MWKINKFRDFSTDRMFYKFTGVIFKFFEDYVEKRAWIYPI